jgi:hypothetical protein
MTCCGPGCPYTHWAPLVLGLRTRKCLIDTRLDVAFRLAADRCQFGYNQVT